MLYLSLFQTKVRLARLFFESSLLLSVVLCCQLPASGQSVTALVVNQPQERNLSGQSEHHYRITAIKDQFFRLKIEQRGINVKVKIVAPDGRTLLEMDATEAGENETAVWIAATDGDHKVTVSSEEKSARGDYRIELTDLRAVTDQDRLRFDAQTEFLAAENLAEENKAESNRQSLDKYDRAAKQWQQCGEKELAALALERMGGMHRTLRDFPAALNNYNQALALSRESKQSFAEGNLLQAIGETYFLANQKDRAIEPFQQSLTIRRKIGDHDGEGSTLNSLGATYSDLGDKREARRFLELALPLRRAPSGKVATMANLGRVLRDLGDKRQALKIQQEVLNLRRTLKNRSGEAAALTDIGLILADLGEHQKALDSFTQALGIQRNPNTISFIGRSYYLLGVPQEALRYHQQAATLARTAKNQRAEIDALTLMALDYWSLEEYATAISTLEQALPLAREIKARDLEASILNNFGRIYSSQEDQRQARNYYNQALPLIRETGNRAGEAATQNNLGFVYEAIGEPTRALQAHQQSVRLSEEIGDRRREAKARYGIARIESHRNRLQPAREQLEKVIKIVESTRSRLNSPELRAEYRASVQQYYDLYIDVLMRMGKRQPRSRLSSTALEVSEQARARSLVELLTESAADIRQGVAPQLVERERDLQEQLNDRTTEQIRISGNRGSANQLSSINKEIEELTSELRNTQTQIRTSSPRYASLTHPRPPTVLAIQRLLDANSILLEFSLGEDRSYLWAVTPSSTRSFTLPKRSEIEILAKRFRDQTTARNQFVSKESSQEKQARVAQADIESTKLAAELGRMLFTPVAHLLGTKRLVIVPDGVLQYIPFSALSIRFGPSRYQPLVVNHEIVSLPSAATLAVLRGENIQRPKATKTVAVLADPVFETRDERVKTVRLGAETQPTAGSASKPELGTESSRILLYKTGKDTGVMDSDFRIPRLPNTRIEAEAILSLAPGDAEKSILDFAANRDEVTSENLSQYRIVHFATHGFLNSLTPELSGLVLSMVDEQGKPRDGYLLAPEIYNLKLPGTELVVLSACQTGLGKEIKGEGIVGMTRGFMYAGAPRVVVSLWSVNDRSTADLMKRFYEAMLARTQRPAAALRSAQLQLLQSKQWQAPYFWAAFGLQGEWQ